MGQAPSLLSLASTHSYKQGNNLFLETLKVKEQCKTDKSHRTVESSVCKCRVQTSPVSDDIVTELFLPGPCVLRSVSLSRSGGSIVTALLRKSPIIVTPIPCHAAARSHCHALHRCHAAHCSPLTKCPPVRPTSPSSHCLHRNS